MHTGGDRADEWLNFGHVLPVGYAERELYTDLSTTVIPTWGQDVDGVTSEARMEHVIATGG